jgi:type I restriction-modification system DNA methylase subunit
MINPTKEQLIDKLRNELYKKYSWTGETAVKFMVPIILAIRFKSSHAINQAIPMVDALSWALNDIRSGGKRELDDTLVQVKSQYHEISPLLRETLDGMINFVTRQPDGVILDILDYIERNENLLLALWDEDFIGSLFERSVSDAFRGDDGRFFTPRNVILIVREMVWLLEKKLYPDRNISDYTVCDPCCGSARFLIYWSENIKDEILQNQSANDSLLHSDLMKELKQIAERSLFGADIHDDTAAYGCLNMLLHGDGATNITSMDSLDHFGFFVDMPLLQYFAIEFQDKWLEYKTGPASQRSDIFRNMEFIDDKSHIITDLLSENVIDLSNPKWLDVMHIIRTLLTVDKAYPTEWDSIRSIQRRFKHHTVFETMVGDWSQRNPDVANGFDIVITNPPFGRKSELQIDDPYILSQYKLATEVYIYDMTRGMTEDLLVRSIAADVGLENYYIDLVIKHFKKNLLDDTDEIKFEQLPISSLQKLLARYDIQSTTRRKGDIVQALSEELNRKHVEVGDNISLADLSKSDINRICSKYLYEENNLSSVIASDLISYFGKEWLTVEDILGSEGYSSKVTLLFNGESHTIYYDNEQKPIVFKNPLPKQVLFIEQFLRLVKDGGKIFTVLDVGVLNNVGDEYVRQFIYKNARIHSIVEFPHGAFKAAEANVKTAIILYEKTLRPVEVKEKIFLSIPQYLGFKLNDQNVPCIRENDLGKTLCDFSMTLDLGRLQLECGDVFESKNYDYHQKICCGWEDSRVCDFWLEYVIPDDNYCPSIGRIDDSTVLSTESNETRTKLEKRIDPKFYVIESRFEKQAELLSQSSVKTLTIAEIVSEPIHRGIQPSYDDISGIIPVLKTVNVQNRKVEWEECRKVTENFFLQQSGGQLAHGDLVVTSTGEGSWGRAAICDIDRAFADGHLTIIKINADIIDPYSVLAFLWSEYGRIQFEQRVRGSTGQTEIYPQDIEKIRILIPRDNEQLNIAYCIKQQFKLISEAKELRQKAIGDIESLLGGRSDTNYN